jgi:diguanylate cyclase (GGDEF)-like protein
VFATPTYEDPFYALFVGLTVYYSWVAQRRWVVWVGAGIGATYLAAHGLHLLLDQSILINWLFAFAKAGALSLLALLLGGWLERRAEREQDLERSRREIYDLNEELTKRLAELHIVAEITEVIHSTLDFESIGHVVLESLKKAIDIPTCSLMVVDRKTDETIFSASTGMDEAGVEPPMNAYFPSPEALLESDGSGPMFTCTNLIEHNEMGVVFCCPADRLDSLSDDDRLVLTAVASELVVAVENSRLYQLTKRLSITDELTGLRNYRFLQQRLDQEYERANRYNRYLSMLMLDIDHFKEFNDSHGHIAGDHALADLAGILNGEVREVDILARYGGEEFGIILPETDAAGAFVVAEKIREAVSMFKFADAGGERGEHLTVSVGVATFPVHALDREALLRQADDALYQAKHFGRDRVRAPRVTSEAPGT